MAAIAALVLAAPAVAQNDRVTQQDCDALREAGNQELAKTCEEALKLQQEQPPQLQQQGGSTGSGSQGRSGSDNSAGSSGTSETRRPKSDSVGLSQTGFPLWPLALAGVACIAGAALLLRRRPDARG
jgi:hypothetical protein